MSAIDVIELIKHSWRGQRPAIRRWGATVALIVLLAPLRSLNLCAVAMLGLVAFLGSRLRIRDRPKAADALLRRPS